MRSTAQHRRGRPVRRLLGVAAGALAVLVCLSTSPTLSAWTAGVVGNTPNTAAPASLAFSHTPTGGGTCSQPVRTSATVTCPDSVLPTVASTGGTVTGTDAVTNNGTAVASSLTTSVSAASCAPVKLDNAKVAADVMLPRYGVDFRTSDPFGGTNAITLDGTGYAAAVTTDLVRANAGSTYGAGIWFKAQPGQYGPLFSLDASPVNAATNNGDDRTVFLTSDGKLNFVYSTGGAKLSSGASYNDGAWHYVYVTVATPALGVTTTFSMSADTRTPVNATALLSSLGQTTGYWHAGWGSTALMGTGSTSYFTGQLSNFTVFNNSPAPAQPNATQLGTQAAFTTWASGATDHWLLGDSGTTTYAGTHPVIGAASPCGYLNVVWSFTNPAATAVTSRTLAAFATGTSYPVGAAPGPGGTQTSSIAVTRAGNYVAYVSGLRLYLPVTYRVQAGSSAWSQTFTWTSFDSVVLG